MVKESLHREMVQYYGTLIRREIEILDAYRTLDRKKSQLQSEIQGAKAYIQTGCHDPAIKREYQKINELKKELLSSSKRTQKAVESKAHVVIRMLQQHTDEGLERDEIVSLLPSFGAEIDPKYLTAILANLRKKGMAVKNGRKFFITSPGTLPAAPQPFN